MLRSKRIVIVRSSYIFGNQANKVKYQHRIMAEAYSSWIQPEVTPEKKITGLKVNNSLSPGKLVKTLG